MEAATMIRSINFVILLSIYIATIIFALISLRKRYLSNRHKAFWVFTILFFPLLGVIALWIVNPQKMS
ncbi:MAG: PLDc N-terminal domain-containing protein [Deltaproteobacteria bacterium]|nr:PLDc N-terminal domain-containing protein [Deltaproteobacteria bacterium]